ncbi:MAG: hypothetical protein C0412_01600 [Flavobacterium sp.]|nr:hypothetical protein [Flavobacterium sp.]
MGLKKRLIELIRRLQPFFCKLIVWTGIPSYFRLFFASKFVTIVNYHDPDPSTFATHIEYLKKHYQFISMDTLVLSLKNGTLKQLPKYSMVITFDDGHVGNKNLFPILKQHNVPAIIFIVAGIVNTHKWFWWKAPNLALGDVIGLKKMPDEEKNEWLLREKAFDAENEFAKSISLSFKDIEVFAGIGGAIGSHTINHPILTMCSPDVVEKEISVSKLLLENELGFEIKHFCFPNGSYEIAHLENVKSAGYHSARTTKPGWVKSNTSPFCLPTMGISDNASLDKLILQVTGIWGCFVLLFEGIKGVFQQVVLLVKSFMLIGKPLNG